MANDSSPSDIPFASHELRAKKNDLPNWYSQVVFAAGIIDDRFDVKGEAVWKPYGYKIMMQLKALWDKLFQDAGIEEMYFPLIVPLHYAEQNKSWWQGFRDEGYKVIAGSKNEIQGILRPTGEPAMYPMFALWIRGHKDLPLRIYETVNSYRHETKQTKPLIRTREITVWHEIHTCHATKEEAEQEMQLHMEFYDTLFEACALPPFKVQKPQWECFPGAVGAVEYYTTTQDARVMENGSVNNLGQAYAKQFNITFMDEQGKEQYAWQVCTGNGARLLGGLIVVHGDDRGLVLPPKIAPIHVVIIPIVIKGKEKEVLTEARKVYEHLRKAGIAVKLDERNETPGSKFYEYEIKGIPLRIELGPKEVAKKSVVVVRRDTLEKQQIALQHLAKEIPMLLEAIQKNLLRKATAQLTSQLQDATTVEDLQRHAAQKKISKVFWCGHTACYDKLGNVAEGLEGFGTALDNSKKGYCLVCKQPTTTLLYVAKTY